MAKGVHLFPSRTQKLSPYTSKVLGWKRPGRIDSCRLKKRNIPYGMFLFLFIQGIYPSGVPGKSESPFSGEPAGEGNKRDSELSQNMRPNREHMERA